MSDFSVREPEKGGKASELVYYLLSMFIYNILFAHGLIERVVSYHITYWAFHFISIDLI